MREPFFVRCAVVEKNIPINLNLCQNFELQDKQIVFYLGSTVVRWFYETKENAEEQYSRLLRKLRIF